ncbi:MAG: pilus assembly protein PilP [Acidithiobacillus sp.]|nr:pilus assembly protein PilP [Acidithiobacillus sp.]
MSVHRFRWIAISILSLALAACSQHHESLTRLKDFVAKGPGPNAKVKPLPKPIHYHPIPFENPLGRDPFTSFSELALLQELAKAGHGPHPDRNGPLLPLEKYPVGSLTLSGFFQINGHPWAVFLTPNGKVYPAGIGDGIGVRNGKITAINPRKQTVTIVQYVPNGFGGYHIQKITLRLTGNN